jgi:hypothetical protein
MLSRRYTRPKGWGQTARARLLLGEAVAARAASSDSPEARAWQNRSARNSKRLASNSRSLRSPRLRCAARFIKGVAGRRQAGSVPCGAQARWAMEWSEAVVHDFDLGIRRGPERGDCELGGPGGSSGEKRDGSMNPAGGCPRREELPAAPQQGKVGTHRRSCILTVPSASSAPARMAAPDREIRRAAANKGRRMKELPVPRQPRSSRCRSRTAALP